MKILKVAANLYDCFRPLTQEDQFNGLKCEDATNAWGKYSRVRLLNKNIQLVRGVELLEPEKFFIKRMFKSKF
jgi:hypothetical protein